MKNYAGNKNLNILLLTKENESKYSEYVEQSPEATTYHTLEWRDISCKVFNHKAQFLIAEGDNGIQGVFPLFLIKGILGRRLVSVPLRDKGGPLYDSPEVLGQLLEAAKKLMIEQKCKYLQIKTWHGLNFHNNKPTWIVQKSHFINSSLELDSNPDAVWNRFHKRSVQRPIKKSQREGVTCYWGKSLGDMNKFYKLFILTRKKLGVPPYGFNLFYEIWEKMIQKGSAGLLLAEYQGTVISGLVVFFFHATAMPAYAASDKKYLDLRPNNLIFWEAIKDSCKWGYTCFDFGADSPDNPSLLSFKAGFGAITEETPHYYFFNGAKESFGMDFDSRKYRIARTLFTKIPLSLSKRIGPIIIRQLG
jgi:FemAB-related protein (PEP-CTERM system-associated)